MLIKSDPVRQGSKDERGQRERRSVIDILIFLLLSLSQKKEVYMMD